MGSGKFPREGYLFTSMRSLLMKNHPYKARVLHSSFLQLDAQKGFCLNPLMTSCSSGMWWLSVTAFVLIVCMVLQEAAYEEMGSSILGRYEEDVFLRFPYWNTSLGIDPFFLICHEMNPEEMAGTRGISIIHNVQCTMNSSNGISTCLLMG